MQFSKWVTLGFSAFCLVVVAAVLRADHLYPMAGILITLPAVSYLMGWWSLRYLRFRRELPSLAWEGEETQIIYSVTNPTKISRFFLTIREQVPGWMQFVDPEPPLFNVTAQDETRVAQRLVFRRRGVYRVASFDVSALDPLGVFAFSQRVKSSGEQVVFPMPRHLESLPLTATEKNGWQEWTASALNGQSVSPDGVREYRQGDSLRRVHWRQTARTGRMSVIEFEEEQSVTLRVILDVSRIVVGTDEIDSPLEYLIRFAASALYLATKQSASASLRLSGAITEGQDELQSLAAFSGRGETHLYEMLQVLARVEVGQKSELIAALDSEAVESHLSASLLLLTTHLEEETVETLIRLKQGGLSVHLIYCDPATFPQSVRRLKTANNDPSLARLGAAGIECFLLKFSTGGELFPERIGEIVNV